MNAPSIESRGVSVTGSGIGAVVLNAESGMLTLNGINGYTAGRNLTPGSLVIDGPAALSLTRVSDGFLQLAGTQTFTGLTPTSAGAFALIGTLNSTALRLTSGVSYRENTFRAGSMTLLSGGAIFMSEPGAGSSLTTGSLLTGSTGAVVNFPLVTAMPGAILVSGSNGLSGANTISQPTLGLVLSGAGTDTMSFSLIRAGTLSISSGMNTSGGTLFLAGSNAGTLK